MSKRLLDLCDSCFYRDYLPDYEPCSNCFKDKAKTGKYTHYVNAIWEQEKGNEWFSDKEVTPKQTNGERIRAMTDEELDDWLNYICDAYYMPSSGWLNWLKQEIVENTGQG